MRKESVLRVTVNVDVETPVTAPIFPNSISTICCLLTWEKLGVRRSFETVFGFTMMFAKSESIIVPGEASK